MNDELKTRIDALRKSGRLPVAVRMTTAGGSDRRSDYVLLNPLAPGDVCVMTAAVACLHEQHPGRVRTWVDTSAPELWDNNPHVEPGEPPAGTPRVELGYPMIDRSSQEPRHFIEAYAESLSRVTGLPVRMTRKTPAIYLSDDERKWTPQVFEGAATLPAKYWVINAGIKSDFTAKWWGRANYQALVDRLQGRVRFVQIGEVHHHHPALRGVLDLRGKTDTRQLVRLVHHAAGAVGPTTFLQHVAAGLNRPYVCILGAREPVQWVQYPKQTTLHTVGALACCENEACWRSRTVPLNDGQDKADSLCLLPTMGDEPIPTCMALIGVDDVANAVMRYTNGTALL